MVMGTKAQAFAQVLQQALAAHAQGNLVHAERYCLKALKTDRSNFTALNLLGVIAVRQGRHEAACRLFVKALKVKPDNAEVHCNLANALSVLKRFEAAIMSYRRAIAIQADYAQAHFFLGVALKAVNLRQEADSSFARSLAIRREALARRPNDFLARHQLGNEFAQLGDVSTAMACYREALAINPDLAAARGAVVMYQLPIVFDDGQSIAEARVAFARELAELGDWLEAKRPIDGYAAFDFDKVSVFYLAYQEQDNLDLLSRYGDLSARTLMRWQQAQEFSARGSVYASKIRIGIVLANVTDNSVWNAIVKGWVEHIDRIGFELHLFQLGPRQDDETRFAMSRTMHSDLTGKSLRELVDSILARELDILIYPEIGMHPKPALLASLRLAPVQVASWGHPETTGLPTIDYFLSAEDLEPPGAQKNYREHLVLLPHLGCCYQPPAVVPVAPDLERLGIASDRPLLLCAGMPFKYAPQFDWVFVELARQLGSCQLVFFVNDEIFRYTAVLRQRLEAAFARSRLTLRDYTVFIPWQQRPEYYGLLARADVHLDTIGFSGFNTAIQSIECGLPVVTREGRFLRGRLASGILKRIGLPELVAATEEEYVALAIRLVRDPAYRKHIRQRIEASRNVLFGDLATIRALEQFCTDVVRRRL